MPYFTPYVDNSGLHIPTYQDIIDTLLDNFRSIYGQDCYLDEDSADYQYMAVIALKISDCLQAIQLAYNSRSPSTAIGAALDAIVKMNGIRRLAASYSTCVVKLTGSRRITITNGVVQDENGYKWDLPTPVTLVAAGSPLGSVYQASVTVTCQELGAITALPETITTIVTPTSGWTGVTNDAAATPGTPVETDAQLRVRQAISVALASTSLLTGTLAAILAVTNVTRAKVYENPTNETDANGHPAHSITAVVEGGEDEDIAEAIYENRGIGAYVNGDQEVEVTDEDSGVVSTMRFYRVESVPIYVSVNITKLSLYSGATPALIKTAVANYLNSADIGETLRFAMLYKVILEIVEDTNNPSFTISDLNIGKEASPLAKEDIVLTFQEATEGIEDNIMIYEEEE
jgi:uncharacterized phage protein gp47/JayE